jgi:hypothetical protein
MPARYTGQVREDPREEGIDGGGRVVIILIATLLAVVAGLFSLLAYLGLSGIVF